MSQVISMKRFSKIILEHFSYNQSTDQIKLIDKNIFQYPKTKDTKLLFWSNHNIIKKNSIVKFVEELLTSKRYSTCRVIHPYLLALSWNNIKDKFKKKYCESSECYELVPKSDDINFRIQTRECLKIIQKFISLNNFEDHFEQYYNYLLSPKGITVEEIVSINELGKNRYIDIKLSFSDKISIYLEINEKHHDKLKDNNRAIEIFSRTGTMPILYYQNEQDMTNLMPQILKEFAFAISKKDKTQAIKFYLIMIDKLDPFFVNMCLDYHNSDEIKISEINTLLATYGMKNFKKYIKSLIKNNLLDDTIDYEDNNYMDGTVTPTGLDIIFMRLNPEDFANETIAFHMCKQYSQIKQKYINTLQNILDHNDYHFQTIFENRNKLASLYKDISPINNIVEDMLTISYQYINEDSIKYIKTKLNIELHPTYMFLVRQNGRYIDGKTFKKISKATYHATEETSSNITNYRWIKKDEWEKIKEILNN